jgi:hypothetical protein
MNSQPRHTISSYRDRETRSILLCSIDDGKRFSLFRHCNSGSISQVSTMSKKNQSTLLLVVARLLSTRTERKRAFSTLAMGSCLTFCCYVGDISSSEFQRSITSFVFWVAVFAPVSGASIGSALTDAFAAGSTSHSASHTTRLWACLSGNIANFSSSVAPVPSPRHSIRKVEKRLLCRVRVQPFSTLSSLAAERDGRGLDP